MRDKSWSWLRNRNNQIVVVMALVFALGILFIKAGQNKVALVVGLAGAMGGVIWVRAIDDLGPRRTTLISIAVLLAVGALLWAWIP